MAKRILVTGGWGFIGSAFLRRVASEHDHVVNIDAHTYAADPRRLGNSAVRTVRADIASPEAVEVITAARPDVVVHFAAETHVTRSEAQEEVFFRTNVHGTRNLLQAAEAAGVSLFVHVSTDEVYGPCEGEPFHEDDKEPGEGRATSPYARSKAVGDDLARSFADRVPTVIVRPTNCFGPWQHPEKAVARWSIRAVTGRPLPVWGDGLQVRDWMAVDDCAAAIALVAQAAPPGETYNVAPERSPRSNLEVARLIAAAAHREPDAVYCTAYDRPQHDRRYAVDASKIRALGWSASMDLEAQFEHTVRWYHDNEDWWGPLEPDAEGLYDDARGRSFSA